MEITIDLPKQVFQDVSILAKRRKKSIGKLIKQAVLREMQESAEQEQNITRPLADCSDEEVLATAKLMMPKEQSDEMSDLLYKNQNGNLTLQERNMLDSLMVVYQLGNLRKSQGIYEAVLRGLIKTPEDLQ
jgi:hypothetical protein